MRTGEHTLQEQVDAQSSTVLELVYTFPSVEQIQNYVRKSGSFTHQKRKKLLVREGTGSKPDTAIHLNTDEYRWVWLTIHTHIS